MYIGIKVLHILATFALVGPLMLAPRWLYLSQEKTGKTVLHDLHKLTGIAGWIVLLSGIIMLVLLNGALLHALWMQISIALFIAVQLFDHFWADAKEDDIAKGIDKSFHLLKMWLIIKLGLYALITLLMVIKI